MKPRYLLPLALALAVKVAAVVVDVNLPYKDLHLKDGTVLTEVAIKSFNNVAETALLLTNRQLITVQTALLPDEVRSQLQGLVPNLSSEELAAAKAREAEIYDKALKRAEHRQELAEEEARKDREASRSLNLKLAENTATKKDKLIEEVAKVAADQAKIYFNYRDDPHSNIGAVIGSDLQLDDPEPVPGWAGRYRVSGTAYRKYINNQGSGFGRGAKEFDMLIQTSDNKKPEIVDISVK